MRKRRFPWTDSLERSLITSYARYRASLGARFHRVDWVAIPGLPAPPEICRRRIASFKHELTVRKALMNLCTLLATRYAKHLQQLKREQALDNDNVGISKGLVKSLAEKSCS
jgi:general transcription factor 3C polypeptide 1